MSLAIPLKVELLWLLNILIWRSRFVWNPDETKSYISHQDLQIIQNKFRDLELGMLKLDVRQLYVTLELDLIHTFSNKSITIMFESLTISF